MTDEGPPGPAEERLHQHLLVLREEPPRPSQALTVRIVRHARWQRVVREPLRVVGRLLSAAVSGFAVVTGLRRRTEQ